MTVNDDGGVLRIGNLERTFGAELALRYDIPELPGGPRRDEFLAGHGADVRVVVTAGSPGVDADTMAALPNLGAIVNYGAGVDSIDLDEARRRGIGVSNTPGYLVNIARGSVVDQDALVELLAAGGLAGAGLDVFADEPHVPAELVGLDNVVVFPHIGSATARTRRAMALLAIRNLDSYLTTGELVTPVLRPARR